MADDEPAVSLLLLANRPDWCPRLAGWYFREWPELYPAGGLDQAIEETRACLHRDALNCTVVAEAGGEPIGAASLLIDDMLPYPEYSPWLATVVVEPQFRGRGIGSRVVLAAMDHARALGIGTLHLWTPGHRGFYEQLGWRFLHEHTIGGEVVAVMRAG